ncbi:MAG TPA: hypothetical protein VK633_11105 [Verrucomicrobiae bacterium]|nr:hypothetical protein [Verrucomicrobiae bacterium]
MDLAQLSKVLASLGCPPDKTLEMARQLDKRAGQLAAQKNQTYDEALAHLLSLFQKGWAAQGPPP